MCDEKKEKIRTVLTEVFHAIDKDKSGFLDQAELETVIKTYLEHPECPAEAKAEHGSPEKIKELCEVRSFTHCYGERLSVSVKHIRLTETVALSDVFCLFFVCFWMSSINFITD